MVSTSENWIDQTATAVFNSCAKADWKGYDPFDGLTSPLLKKFLQQRWSRLFSLQLVKRFPFNLRPWLGIKPQENAMTWVALVSGALEAYGRGETSKMDFIQKGIDRIWSLQTKGTGLWGYPFPWQSKAFYLPAGEPNLVLSALCLRALAKEKQHREQCRRSAESLYKTFYKKEVGYFSYVAHEPVLVHNANLFGAESLAWFLPEKKERIETAVQKSLMAQADSGRWAYGDRPHHQWCDNFHTAYNLIALNNIYSIFKWEPIATAIRRGLNYYLTHAFTEEGKPRYYDNRITPMETHGAAVALICFKEMVRGGWMEPAKGQEWTKKIVATLKGDFYLGDGKFLYRKGRVFTDRTVFTRWTQAWVYYGLEAAKTLGLSETEVHRERDSFKGLMGHQTNR